MNFVEERILREGRVFPGNILKVDSFLNHQIDVNFLNEVGREFKSRFADCAITKILTVEASGIAVACIAAQYFNVPVIFAKKSQSLNLSPDIYSARVKSYTHGKVYDVIIAKSYLNNNDKVLIVDDFLAVGNALAGLRDLVGQAGAEAAGAGIVIEKGFQGGGDMLRESGFRVESLAIIEAMDETTGKVMFRG